MKKIAKKIILCFSFILLVPFFYGCGEKEIITDKTTAKISNWYVFDEVNYFDTSVTFDNSNVSYITWEKVTFTLYKANQEVLGNAVSEGENLDALLEDSKKYWSTEQTQLTLNNAFRARTQSEDNGYWVRSKMEIEDNSDLSGLKLVVEIETPDKIYKAEYTKQ